MTNEELENKATEWIRSQGWSEENLPNNEYIQMCDAYIAGAKAIEKEIEILANHNKELSANLSDAESMITKMMCCRNCEQSYKENGELRCDVVNCFNFDKWSLAE